MKKKETELNLGKNRKEKKENKILYRDARNWLELKGQVELLQLILFRPPMAVK